MFPVDKQGFDKSEIPQKRHIFVDKQVTGFEVVQNETSHFCPLDNVLILLRLLLNGSLRIIISNDK